MDYNKLETDIRQALDNELQYLKQQPYWGDIYAFCLYTDESYMSLTLNFNTHTFLEKKRDDPYFLTYKYSPAEWFSEQVDDARIQRNEFFSGVAKQLQDGVLGNEAEEGHGRQLIEACTKAMNQWAREQQLSPEQYALLIMVSDSYDRGEILEMNEELTNSEATRAEFLQWCDNEL